MHTGSGSAPKLSELAGHFEPAAAARFLQQGDTLHRALQQLYGDDANFAGWFEHLAHELAQAAAQRPANLKELDTARCAGPDWFLGQSVLAYCAYADRFGGSLLGVATRIPYLQELGVNVLHLLPFLRARAGDNDGGFAVSSFEEVQPSLGANEDLDRLTAELRRAGISLVADLVLNHVADDHEWAIAARAGDRSRQDFFHVLHDETSVHQAEQSLEEVFPGAAPGNFTYVPQMGGWVWTTFYPYQWDLNYANPQVFFQIAIAMLRLANRGVEIFRLDSAPFLWKRTGTTCRNLPEVHTVLAALRAIVEICAPAVLLMAEAIVPVQELGPYLGVGMPARRECHIAYHSSLMAASWASLVREDCTALRQVSAQTPPLPALAAWVTYVRCHDDIVWPVLQTDEAGAAAWLPDELRHVAAFLQGESASSYARGRASFGGGEPGALHGTNGMTAALVGLATASGADEYAAALQRMLLLYGLAMTFGGIPLIYMGDELGQGNDDSEQALRMSRLDSRWIQRPPMDTARLAQHRDPASAAGAVFTSLRSWIGLRQSQPALRADVPATVLSTAHAAVFGLGRGDRFVAYFNFSGQAQLARLPGRARWRDLRSQQSCTGLLPLDPWQMRWLTREPA